MQIEIFKEADKIWKNLTNGAKGTPLHFDADIYKPLLNFFMPGDFYYYIFNVKNVRFEFISPEITAMLGYPVALVDVNFFMDKIHPDDQPWFLNFETKVAEFFTTLQPKQVPNYKVRYDYRVRKSNQEYIRILQQVVTIQSEEGKIIRTLGVHTDISHLKKNGQPVLSFIGLNIEPSYLDVKAEEPFKINKSDLTRRELEVVHMIAQGKSSEDISQLFFISKQTVNTHRRNILKKSGCINAVELTTMAIQKGWV